MIKARIAVVGAGWAGLSAAVQLTARGHAVTVFEATRQCGGRARRVDWNLPDGTTIALDNGQHILLGAYRDTLALMRMIGVDPGSAFLRSPLTLCNVAGLRLRAPRIFAPLHLVSGLILATGLSFSAKRAMLMLMIHAWRIDWRVGTDLPLNRWLDDRCQPFELVHKIWAPLCVAALNTPVTIASTQVFLNVLRDSLGARRLDSDMLLPRVPLDATLPDAAVAFIRQRTGDLRYGNRVTAIDNIQQGCNLSIAQGPPEYFDAAILAVPAHQVSRLTARLAWNATDSTIAQCDAFLWQPIVTVYLLYPPDTHLRMPMLALDENPDTHDFGQWVFDRGQIGGAAGLMAVVISAHGAHEALSQEMLLASITRQLATQARIQEMPIATRVITEKRATFACVPGLARPTGRTPWGWLALAGDYTQSDYPSTLEAAVTSGRVAAQIISEGLIQREKSL